MGTRHLTLVCLDGKYPVAQYGQWDGYPGGQGMTALKFLLTMDRVVFTTKVRGVVEITDEELDAMWVQCGAEPNADGHSLDVSDEFKRHYPELHRDTGAEILDIIAKYDSPLKLRSVLRFAGDSLYCEWAYVIDLDKGTFEVYEGFNHEPLEEGERFASIPDLEQRDGYFPVKFLASFQLDALPTPEEFIRTCEPDEDDDENTSDDITGNIEEPLQAE